MGHRFESCPAQLQFLSGSATICLHRLVVRTPDFHSGNGGSIPPGDVDLRTREYLDFHWYYSPQFQEAFIAESKSRDYSGQWLEVQLPHSNVELPNSYFDDQVFAFVSAYRRHLKLPTRQQAQQLALLRFEGVMNYAEIYLNGEYIANHRGGYTPFEVALPDGIVRWGSENELLIKVDSTERRDTPPFGYVIDYLTYGGIYREVSLHICKALHFGTVKLTPIISQAVDNKDSLVSGKLDLEMEIINPFGLSGPQQLELRLKGWQQSYTLELTGREVQSFVLESAELQNLKLWDIGQGSLYQVELQLNDMDCYRTRVGWRDCRFTPEGFWLNGRYEKLVGLNRHQSYPYAGYAMPANAQNKDADLLREYGCKILRTSHYPQHREFIEHCDEIGLLVFSEIPGWQHIGQSEDWHEQVLADVRDMILRDYNSPCIVLWGVRINESIDHHELYSKTNALAHSIDPTRQTGGVRCLPNSELLEDVYTMNNFVLNACFSSGPEARGAIALSGQQEITGLERAVPYLVSESNGHMFPTKAWDPEERRTEHAVRHLRVIDAAYATAQHSGSISWCAFDYNTHHEFGAGDKICHHGVFDMYRQPKFAAWAYRSQKDPSQEIVLEPLSCWARGERDECLMGPLWVLHNCDYIELYINGKQRLSNGSGKVFPARGIFKGLPHPPSVIWQVDSAWGEAFEGAEFKGFIAGQEVASRKFLGNPVASRLRFTADQVWLSAQRPQATRLVLQVVDQLGNPLPFFFSSLRLRLSGAQVKIYADEVQNEQAFTTLRGGSAAVWLLSRGHAGTVAVEAQVLGYRHLTAQLQVEISAY